MAAWVRWFSALALCFAGVGCRSRCDHVRNADRDAYYLIHQKTCGKPWTPTNFNLIPPSESRLAVRGCYVSPCLPSPTTSLYAYNLPLLRSDNGVAEDEAPDTEEADTEQPLGRPIPPEAWQALPSACLQRMIDFQSIRQEASYTTESFDVNVLANEAASAQKLSLEDVVDLAVLNARDYQTQKENLYLTALALSAERFDYQWKFRTTDGFSLNYDHDRSGGVTENTLGIPSGVGISKALVTGGDVLASFANNIILTFNGPSGFSKDISSRLLFDFAQPLVQRDIQFESLTQAERNLVYAARDFARFRKQFFVRFASTYYSLIRLFRQIEIDSQNYFSLVRAFNQAEQEFLAGLVPRFQVDQVEQSLLSGRGDLIGTCNSVEEALDSLKLGLGIPTETKINVDLSELNQLTRMDQLSVATDSALRVISRLETALEKPDRIELLSTASVLLDRLINAARLREASEDEDEIQTYLLKRQVYLIDYSRLNSQQILVDLQREIQSDSPSLSVIFQRSLAHCESLLRTIDRQLDYLAFADERDAEDTLGLDGQNENPQEQLADGPVSEADSEDDISDIESEKSQRDRFAAQREAFSASVAALIDDLSTLIEQVRVQELQSLVDRASVLSQEMQQLIDEIDRTAQLTAPGNSEADLTTLVEEMRALVNRSRSTLSGSSFGLQPIEIDNDDAMLTAIVLRYELMNQREQLADSWRQIKLAADDLKAVIDFQATQIIDTDSNTNNPFNFTFDDSSTSLGLSVDAPLNRFLERNAFRASLISYQRALRNLSQLEDDIKFDIRNNLRDLSLDREQYLIAVASAALAYERVVSTSLEFRLGTGGVTARDFLEAQTAYTNALSNVASRHINYIVDRATLFLNLELLAVDDAGFWQDIRREDLQPEPYYELPPWAYPVYGTLPCVCYSDEMRQMLCVPVQRPASMPVFMPELRDIPAVEELTPATAVPADSTNTTANDTSFDVVPPPRSEERTDAVLDFDSNPELELVPNDTSSRRRQLLPPPNGS